jgi:hypothetical protein
MGAGIRERSLMVGALVRWGSEDARQLAYKRDQEIEDMVDRLERSLVVPDLSREAQQHE